MQADLAAIQREFDDDIQELLRSSNLTTKAGEERRRKRNKAASFLKSLGGGGPETDVKGGDVDAVPAMAFARGGDDD